MRIGEEIGVLSRNLIIHIEEVAIFFFYHFHPMMADVFGGGFIDTMLAAFNLAIAIDRGCIIEINGLFGRTNAVTGITALFGGARCHVARHQVAEGRVSSFQVVVSFFFGDLTWFARIVLLFRHPNAPVIA